MLLLTVAFLAVAYAQNNNDNENKCNITGIPGETTQNAVPIYDFQTSGADSMRQNWCISYCKGRRSIEAAAVFQPYNSSSPVVTLRSYRLPGEKRVFETFKENGEPYAPPSIGLDSGNEFCLDNDMADIADQVFANSTNLKEIAQGLNYYVNKPGWAYLVFQVGPAPGYFFTDMTHIDRNFCIKTYYDVSSDF
ncbi:hypothetical protein Q1695_004601 [Nippostrongylus brasiliensis]|nr:hypothetical protein Q1695_004601 [Nippostrongylus brasiliensis]